MSASDGPAGPSPDYLADENRGPGIIASSVIMAFIATVFVGLRFYTRMFIVRKLWLADWIILFALVFSLGNSAGSIRRKPSSRFPLGCADSTPEEVAIRSTGRHIWTIAPDTLGPWMKV